MTETLEEQFEKIGAMSDSEREMKAAIWSIIFLISEMALAMRVLRDKLAERGVLTAEDEEAINTLASQEENMQKAYGYMEQVFRNKYNQVMEVISNPEEVERRLSEAKSAQAQSHFQGATTAGTPGPGSAGILYSEAEENNTPEEIK